MMSIVARSARVADGHADAVPDEVVARGSTAAETFLLRWRGEADPRHVKAIDTYWICTAEHGLNASTFTARVVASTGADSRRGALVGRRRALRAAARRRARLRQADARGGRGAGRRRGVGAGRAREREADHGLRPPRLPGRGPALAHPQTDRDRARVAVRRRGAGPRDGRARRAPGAPSRARARHQRRVLLGDRARHRRDPAAARARDVRLLARRRLVGAHPRAEADRASCSGPPRATSAPRPAPSRDARRRPPPAPPS